MKIERRTIILNSREMSSARATRYDRISEIFFYWIYVTVIGLWRGAAAYAGRRGAHEVKWRNGMQMRETYKSDDRYMRRGVALSMSRYV